MVLKIETKLHELAGLIIDLNFIQNFWQIIKIRISAQWHKIYFLKKIKKVIKEK